MAAAVFSSLGQALGGPFGAMAGAVAGSAMDSITFGRMDRTAVEQIQRSAYGVAIPRVFGRVRVAGVLIWAHVTDQGAKGSGQRSGMASFAIALSSRPIMGVARIWADGREIRDASGLFETPTTMRVYRGDNREADPIIEAVEGLERAPAFGGLAYVVFENLALEAFGNRIPNLSFEVEADTGHIGDWISEVGRWPGDIDREGGDWIVGGYVAGGARLGDDMEAMMQLAGAHVCYHEGEFAISAEGQAHVVPHADLLSGMATMGGGAIEHWTASVRCPAGVAISYLDPSRDYQAGLQRVARGHRGQEDQVSVAAAMSAADARRMASGLLRSSEFASEEIRLTLGWKWIHISVGDTIRLEGEASTWRIVRRVIRGLAVQLTAVRQERRAFPAAESEAGRALAIPMVAVPPTELHVFEIMDDANGAPQVAITANGGPGWKGCVVYLQKSWERVELWTCNGFAPVT